MKLRIIVLFFLSCYIQSFGQYKQMLHKPYKEKVDDIDHLYRNTVVNGVQDSLHISHYTNEMKEWALKNGDKELALEADLLRAYSYVFIYGHEHQELIRELIPIAEKAKKENILHIENRAVQAIATQYWRIENYEKAFEWLLRSEKIMKGLTPSDFPNMAAHLNFIGRCHYYFKDYSKAITYYEKSGSLTKTDFNALAVIEAQNTLGLCHQKLGNLDQAKFWFQTIIADTSAYNNKIWKGIASGNLGYNYYLEGDYQKAIPLFEIDIDEALNQNDYSLATGSLIPLSDIYIKQNRLDIAKQKIDLAEKYIRQSGLIDRFRDLYPVMSKWYAANNDPKRSAAYLDSTMLSIEAYNEKYNSLKLLRATQKVEDNERKLEIEKLKSQSQLKLTQRNFIIALITILLVISILAYWFRNKYLLKNQQIKELALENTQKALTNAKAQLENLILKVRKDSILIQELHKEKSLNNTQGLLSELKSKNILTQDDWLQYQKMFKKVYPDFFPSVIASFPDLSQAEIRCLCLEKLQLSNHEMALVLGVSANTIRVTKHRIRKKLGIENHDDILALIN